MKYEEAKNIDINMSKKLNDEIKTLPNKLKFKVLSFDADRHINIMEEDGTRLRMRLISKNNFHHSASFKK